ncbi:hypothetical protein CKAN_01019800 [Cinnamomum micranthum f. kanehirae]|uniref:Uncharacterized protein n=1 Tax=Cinnamomum micranthum f. kanehirae TaxID=337451 RepID=A0A443NSM1_9MAGN|nr:hypothetical protein CKAN_01019800 [Cinnamomum micranthum f. kanehirae]
MDHFIQLEARSKFSSKPAKFMSKKKEKGEGNALFNPFSTVDILVNIWICTSWISSLKRSETNEGKSLCDSSPSQTVSGSHLSPSEQTCIPLGDGRGGSPKTLGIRNPPKTLTDVDESKALNLCTQISQSKKFALNPSSLTRRKSVHIDFQAKLIGKNCGEAVTDIIGQPSLVLYKGICLFCLGWKKLVAGQICPSAYLN